MQLDSGPCSEYRQLFVLLPGTPSVGKSREYRVPFTSYGRFCSLKDMRQKRRTVRWLVWMRKPFGNGLGRLGG